MRRAAQIYAHDASNYRSVPLGVVIPQANEDVDRGGRGVPALRRADRLRAAAARRSPGRP